MPNDIAIKIRSANLTGRGGAGFPTALKWEMVKSTHSKKKFVICNASEGEIGIFKDFYILKNFPEKVFHGMRLAMDYIGTREAYFNINNKYYSKLKNKFAELIKIYKTEGYKFHIFKEDPSYIGGEETALLNAIEGKRVQPRLKPPFPSVSGLFGKPTLINNVETFFNVSDVCNGIFENKRFYSISGDGVRGSKVYHLQDNWSIEKILQETGNIPSFKYFVQIGGSASGLVLNSQQISNQEMIGAGSIEIFRETTSSKKMLKKWFDFYLIQSCGKCTPCREGTYQLVKILQSSKSIPWKKIMDIIEVLENTPFCALGRSLPVPVKSYMKNILKIKI